MAPVTRSQRLAALRANENNAATDTDTTSSPDPQTAAMSNTLTVFEPLMDLPPELVLRIMAYAVVTSTKSHPLRITAEDGESVRPPAITRVNKLFRKEGVKLFYTQNVFLASTTIGGADSLWAWLAALAASTAAMLERLYVEWVDTDGGKYAHVRADGRLYVDNNELATYFQFLTEFIFFGEHVGEATPRHRLYFCTRGGKVVLDVGQPEPRYQLSIRRGQQTINWTPIQRYLELFGDAEGEEELRVELGDAIDSTNFWVAETDI